MIIPLLEVAGKYNLPPLTRIAHVGGHYGEEYDDYIANGAERIVFFEPVLSSFLEMQRRLADKPKVELVHAACGAANGHTTMYIETANAGQSSSILEAKLHATQYPQITFDGREEVAVMRFDDWANGAVFDFMSIDVQGYELQVLMGAGEALYRIQALNIEINREELYKGCARVEEIDELLMQFGFKRVETEWCGGTWGEGIYVR